MDSDDDDDDDAGNVDDNSGDDDCLSYFLHKENYLSSFFIHSFYEQKT